jgi:hypothetical protein
VSLIKEYALLQFGQRNTLEVKTSYQMTNKIRAIKNQRLIVKASTTDAVANRASTQAI